MGPISLGTRIVASGSGGGTDTSGFILWNGAAEYLTINASGDRFFITLQ